MILKKNFSSLIFLKSAPMCPRGWTVYRKNKNNFVECFKMDGNHQKCRKFSRLNRFLKIEESVDQYLMHLNYFIFSNFFFYFDPKFLLLYHHESKMDLIKLWIYIFVLTKVERGQPCYSHIHGNGCRDRVTFCWKLRWVFKKYFRLNSVKFLILNL